MGMLVGANLMNGEVSWNKAKPFPVSGTDYHFVDEKDIDYLVAKGCTCVRLIFSWEQVQPALKMSLALESEYYKNFKKVVDYCISKQISVVIEPHGGENKNFIRYKNNRIGTSAVPNTAFGDFWKRMANEWKFTQLVLFGLSNEPHDVGTKNWFTSCNTAIKGIRSTGATNTILVSGNGYSNAMGWFDTWYDTSAIKVSNSVGYLAITDPLKNTWVQVHNYFNSDGSGGTDDIVSVDIGVERLSKVAAWAKTNNLKVFVGELGLVDTNPLAEEATKRTLEYIMNNEDVFAGWCWWSFGYTPWQQNYRLSICPKNDYATDDPIWAWLAPYIKSEKNMTIPTAPVAFTKGTTFTLTSSKDVYWVNVPQSYDSTHKTPTKLFVWLHGCGGYSQYDIARVSPGGTAQNWISIAPSGAEGKCWTGTTHVAYVLAAIADIKTHFNIDDSQIIMGGYSSGGDLSYRTAFQNPTMFAGIIPENTSPFRDSGVSQAVGTAVAKKFNVTHVAHIGDTTYPIATVRTEINAMKAAGFPATLIELPGTHWDNDNAATGTGTWLDYIKYGMPSLNAGWTNGTVVVPPPVVVPPAPAIDLKKMRVIARGTSAWETGCCTEFDIMNFSTVSSASWTEAKINLGTNVIRNKADGTPDVWGCTITSRSGSITVKPASWTKLIVTGSKATVGMATDFGNGLTSPTYVSGSLK